MFSDLAVSASMWPFKTAKKVHWQAVIQSESDAESQSEKQPLGPTEYSDDSSSTAGQEYYSHWNQASRIAWSSYLAIALLLSLLMNLSMYIKERRVDLDQVCTERTSINCMFPCRFQHVRQLTTMSRVPNHGRS
jgi:hypothetical protein